MEEQLQPAQVMPETSIDQLFEQWCKDNGASLEVFAIAPADGAQVALPNFIRGDEFRIPTTWRLGVRAVRAK